MKMTSPTGKPNEIMRRRRRAFTLMELMLVMALLIMVIALVTPMLSKFFAGRNAGFGSAAGFMPLTRYGQSRAVSEGVPMMLWVDPRNGTYGLEQEPGYTDGDPKAVDFKLGKDLKIDVAKGQCERRAPAAKASGDPFLSGWNASGSANSVAGISMQEGRAGRSGLCRRPTGEL